ncbi:MAG: stage II sporulation protein R [Clostridiales bacterium]|nr:stage II sporulation protein R [Clostridiales bacterium]
MLKRKIEIIAICAFLFATLVSFTGFAQQCEGIRESVVRLHVLANSDSDADQTLKLQVRDRVLRETKGLFSEAQGEADALQRARDALPLIQKAAEDEIALRGYDYPVTVEIGQSCFNTRTYEEVTLPAGRYDAVRILIGDGAGKNWWCVMFPPMCVPAASESEELSDVLDAEQMEIVGNADRYEVKFKTLEIIEEICGWFA